MKFSIKEYGAYQENEIINLYESVGWTNYTRKPEMLRAAFQNSLLVLGAYDGDRLLGILRAVGDGASILYIQDILVLPEYQRRRVGSSLLERVFEIFPYVYQTVLLTDDTEKTLQFYKSAGFTLDTDAGCRACFKMNLN